MTEFAAEPSVHTPFTTTTTTTATTETTTETTEMTSSIAEFYANKSVFVTGATGFLGKVLVEKLLRGCPRIDKIYLLVRPKRGKQPQERINEIVNCRLFEKVDKQVANYRDKIVIIEGDLCSPGFGVSPTNRQRLIDSVHVIYHSAATVRFDEPLKVAVDMNIVAVKKICELARQCKHLTCLLHVSTAYANCDRLHVSEQVYNAPVRPDRLMEAVEWLDDDLIDKLTPHVLRKRPNTYTYTKAIAESLVQSECESHGIPCSIVRPSIIGASWHEPFAGWIEGWNGPTALFPAVGTGLLRSMLGNQNCTSDLIPVDITVNLMIAAAWYTGSKHQVEQREMKENKENNNNISNNSSKLLVYNCTSGKVNRLTWGKLQEYYSRVILLNPFENIVFVPKGKFTEYRVVKHVRTLFEQALPAYVMDGLLRVANRKQIFVKIQEKITKAVGILEYFTTNQWEFANDNMFMLMNEMNQTDRKKFNLDIRGLKWKSYVEKYCLGAKIHLLKEDVGKVSKLRFKLKKLQRVERFVYWGLLLLFFKMFVLKSRVGKAFVAILFDIAFKLRQLF